MSRDVATPDWGLLPEQVKQRVRQREWDNMSRLKARLSGKQAFPIRIPLKPPAGRTVMKNLAHFQQFIQQWQSFPLPHLVQWETRNYRDIAAQTVPRFLLLESIQDLIDLIGAQAVRRSQLWSQRMGPLLELEESLYPVLIRHLQTLETISMAEAKLLARLLPQLQRSMGQGRYLRALPLHGIDTKFLETHLTLISDLLDVLHHGEISTAGGLHAWLGCLSNPLGWLTVRPLCQSAMAGLGGLPIVQLCGDTLKRQPLPANNILVVENMQTGLGLPELENTIAVFGGGKNVAWMNAGWLQNKRVAYWGDIDTWGLTILSEVRSYVSHVEALMMEATTVKLHEERMVDEPRPVESIPGFLTQWETQLFADLKADVYKGGRLEQERLSADYISQVLLEWSGFS